MLKTTGLPDKPAPRKNNGSKTASSRNNDSKPVSGRNNSNGEVDGFDGDGVEYAKKSGKLKGQKPAKFRKSSKSEKCKGKKSKKPSKSRNLPNFDAKDSWPSFLTPKARSAFNRLWLTFTKAPILRHFKTKYLIQIETDASGYAISDVLSQLTSGTSPDEVVTKADLGQWYPVAFFFRKMIPVKT